MINTKPPGRSAAPVRPSAGRPRAHYVAPSLLPPAGLGGPHAQTIAGSLPLRSRAWRRRAAALRHASREVLLDLPGGVRLLGYYSAGDDLDQGLVVLLHGWEGGADSGQLIGLASALQAIGYAVFRLNLRDHGGTYHLNEELFHSCRIDEVVDAVAAVDALYAPRRLAMAGFSLGGNFALRVGARAAAAGVKLEKIIAVCPVLHPPRTMHALESGFWGYRRYYLRRWRRSLLAKEACFPSRYALGDLRRFQTLTETTDFFVREYTQFEDIDSYLEGYSILGSRLDGLSVPSLVVAAADDPIIPSVDLGRLSSNARLDVTLLPWGGHCGFVMDYRLNSCVEAMIVDALSA